MYLTQSWKRERATRYFARSTSGLLMSRRRERQVANNERLSLTYTGEGGISSSIDVPSKDLQLSGIQIRSKSILSSVRKSHNLLDNALHGILQCNEVLRFFLLVQHLQVTHACFRRLRKKGFWKHESWLTTYTWLDRSQGWPWNPIWRQVGEGRLGQCVIMTDGND